MVSLKKHLVLSKGRRYNPSSTELAPACPPAPGKAPSPGWPRRLSQQQSAGPAAPGVQQPHRLRVWAPSPSLGPVLPRAQWGQTKPARWGQRPHWTKSWHDSEFLDTGPFLGQMKERLDFLHSGTEQNPGQSFVLVPASIDLTTPHLP